MWQDIALTIVTIFLTYALIPQVIKGFKIKKNIISKQTASITSAGMYAISIIYFTLGLFLSTTISLITGTLWLIIFIQSITYKN